MPKKTLEECAEILRPYSDLLADDWMHKATGNCYIILSIALQESDLTPLVVYRRQGVSPIVPFTRPVAEFLEKFERIE